MTSFTDFFDLLGILPDFDLDASKVEEAYFREQRRFHPDRFVGKPETEREEAAQRSADINRAYDTLTDALKRAQYLLLLQGITVGSEHNSVKPSGECLAEAMEWRQHIEDADTLHDLYALSDRLAALQDELLSAISSSCKHSQWQAMAQQTIRLGYILKAREAIAQQKHRLKE